MLGALREVFPDAPLFTLFFAPESVKRLGFDPVAVHPSFLQSLPGITRHFRKLLPLYPLAVERLNLAGYDLIVSSSHAVAKAVRRAPGQVHLCYCHTPMRYAWDLRDDYLQLQGIDKPLARAAANVVLDRLQRWDARTAVRVDRFVANSSAVAERIRKHYGREAAVIHPPVDVDRFGPRRADPSHFLFVSRLVPYKRADLAVRACTRLGLPLKVVGDGPALAAVRAVAGPAVEFLGRQDDRTVANLLSSARALLFPAYEDFGIVPVEAQAAGCPVIAFGRGGVLDTVIPADGGNWETATGVFFAEQTEEALVAALRWFLQREGRFQPAAARRNANRFARARFMDAIAREARELTASRAAPP